MLLLWQSGPLLLLAAQSVGCVVVIPSLSHPLGFRLDSASGPCTKPFSSAALRVSFTDDDAAIAVELSLPIAALAQHETPSLAACFQSHIYGLDSTLSETIEV